MRIGFVKRSYYHFMLLFEFCKHPFEFYNIPYPVEFIIVK